MIGIPFRASTILAVLLCQFLTFGQAARAQESAIGDYVINPGDLLSVLVWKEEGLQRQILVRPDGAFSFPLAGEIQARDKSVEDIRQILTDRLAKYIPDPVVTVAVESAQGNQVYVIGQVNRPGAIPAPARIDVLQALSIAGGFTPFAQQNDILILRRDPAGALNSIRFRFKQVEKGKNLEQNIVLHAGDVIIVP